MSLFRYVHIYIQYTSVLTFKLCWEWFVNLCVHVIMSCPKLLRIHCHTLKSQYNLCLHCSFAYSHRNLFGRNQKLHVSLERGQIDSLFRINYSDPWISGDDMRTSRTIMVQVDLMFYVSSATLSNFSYYSKFLAEMFDQFFFQ